MYKSIKLEAINIVISCKDVQWIEKHKILVLFNSHSLICVFIKIFFIINIHQETEAKKTKQQQFSILF